MRNSLIAAVLACCLGKPALAADWIERYFGIGSGGDRTAACGEARDHAQGNSFKACMDRRGKRADAEYTDCICASRGERMHVCNVNLKVRCDAIEESGQGKGQAGRGMRGVSRRRRPAPVVREGAP